MEVWCLVSRSASTPSPQPEGVGGSDAPSRPPLPPASPHLSLLPFGPLSFRELMAAVVPARWSGRFASPGQRAPARAALPAAGRTPRCRGLFFFRTPTFRPGFRQRRAQGARRALGGAVRRRRRDSPTSARLREAEPRRDRGRQGGRVGPVISARRNSTPDDAGCAAAARPGPARARRPRLPACPAPGTVFRRKLWLRRRRLCPTREASENPVLVVSSPRLPAVQRPRGQTRVGGGDTQPSHCPAWDPASPPPSCR